MKSLQNQHDGPQITLTDAASANLPLHTPNTPPKDGISPTKHEIDAGAPVRPFAGNADPFASPTGSRPSSPSFGSSNAPQRPAMQQPHALRYFHSRLVKKGEVEKGWLGRKDPKEKWVTILPLIGIFIGLALAAFLVWDGLSSVVHHKYCLVLDENFDGSGLDSNVWTQEVQVGGFGNGEFEQATTGSENVFISDGSLIIRATLQDADKVQQNTVIDLLQDGSCTSKKWSDCVAVTNVTNGNSSIVPPVKSGRINTRNGVRIKYGRVEVTAKLPQGDWLWPAIWMMPIKDTYGPWPSSGEIDIMESRGNNWTYAQGGNDIISSALHWGPDPANDAWWKTNNKRRALRSTYSNSFNTFGLEWSQKYLFTYVNGLLLQVLYVNFNKPMWNRGGFPDYNSNGTHLANMWSQTGRRNTPFDEEFYLIINLAVGGTNGWFEDGKSGKPWDDLSESARKDFWNARETWYPTWVQPQLEVSRVKILQQCDGDEEL